MKQQNNKKKKPHKRNPIAHSLANPKFRQRVVPNKKKKPEAKAQEATTELSSEEKNV